MKKLLVIAILMLALVFTVVACTEEKPDTDTTVADTTVETPTEALTDPSEETTEGSEETTEKVTTEEVTTEEVTTEEVTTEEVTTEEVTTEEVTTADPADPETPDVPAVENYNVPQELWTVSGDRPGIRTSAESSMVKNGGIESGALLYKGSVGLGEIDLSKYSKVIVMYGIDGSAGTAEKHAASDTNRIMLTTEDNDNSMTPGGDIIASVEYTELGWAVKAIEIDLTGVDYNGNVFLTWDNLSGTTMLIGSVEFIA